MARALVLALLLALAACGRDAPPADAPVRLQVFGDPHEVAAYRELIAAYARTQPGDRVELIPIGRQGDHMARLTTAFAAGDPPELFIVNFRRFGQFAGKGVLAPLGPALAVQGRFVDKDFYEPALEAFRYDGVQMCVPQNVSSLVVYYNRALFQKYAVPMPNADWTVADMLRAARTLTRDTDPGDKQQRVDLFGLAFEPSLIRIAPFVWILGGELVDDTVRPTLLTLDRPREMLALAFVKSLISLHRIVPTQADFKAEDHESRFARGGLGMLLQSRRLTASLRAVPGLDWDVAPFPRSNKRASVLHADAYCMAKDAKNRAAAERFAAFALGEEGQRLLARSGRTVPSRIAVAQSPAFLDPGQRPAAAQVFLDAIPHLRRTPNIAAWHEVETRADKLIEEWFYEPPLPRAGEQEGGAMEGYQIAAQLRDAVNPLIAPPPKP